MNLPKYKLEKSIWTEADFDKMGWHDSWIYALGFITPDEDKQSDLILDIDYIFEWIQPNLPDNHFTFQIAPCTLVFHEISDLKMELETGLMWQIELEIDELNRRDENGKTIWTIETHNGYIEFQASGFSQFVRSELKHVQLQSLSDEQRGGISFEQKSISI
jgi:hypothetical protein